MSSYHEHPLENLSVLSAWLQRVTSGRGGFIHAGEQLTGGDHTPTSCVTLAMVCFVFFFSSDSANSDML